MVISNLQWYLKEDVNSYKIITNFCGRLRGGVLGAWDSANWLDHPQPPGSRPSQGFCPGSALRLRGHQVEPGHLRETYNGF
ncbi:hypothetical protein J6590_044890 [Homalodisca vitripennis]|nr:hypothetical protein J6590_044890 [Homalodisca vitripennis]